jgi:hypothetical protein
MAASPQPTWNPPPPPPRWGPGRVIALVLGILVLLPAVGLTLGGGLLLWADGPGRNDDGYLYSSSDGFSTDGYAITSGSVDLATGADWLPVSAAVGTARLEVTGSGGSDVFIGIAPVADATTYIGGVERTIVTDLGSDAAPAVRTGTGAPSTPPGEQDFWVAQADGSGTQTLTWKPAAGNWTLIVMNSDGSRGVSMDARLGATIPALTGLAWGLFVAGLFLLALGTVVIVLAARRRPAPAPWPPQGGVPAGPPPYWTPPAPVDRTTAADARYEAPTPAPPPGPPPAP